MNEFSLIKNYFAKLSPQRQDVTLGIGDDCALLRAPVNQLLAVTTDTLVAGVHFFADAPPYELGYKALAVNLSDLAAMGAEPAWVSLAITLPAVDESWLAQFCAGFAELLKLYQLQLIGGDTTQGPLSITITTHGYVPENQALKRDAAKPGDNIYVTGTLGDAGAGLKILKNELQLAKIYVDYLIERLYKPMPRIREGFALRGIAHAAVDISDGLAADLKHILALSRVGATLYVDCLPLSPALKQAIDKKQAWQLALTAGDDYELCFTVPQAKEATLRQLEITCTRIGVIEQAPGLRLQLSSGKTYDLAQQPGYQHFG